MQRVELATGRVYTCRSRIRRRLFVHNRGFACVPDGPAMASQLARYLAALSPTADGGVSLAAQALPDHRVRRE